MAWLAGKCAQEDIKVKIGISLITNRPDKFERFMATLPLVLSDKHEFILAVNFNGACQPMMHYGHMRHIYKASYKDENGLINYAQARLDCFALLEDCDYIFMCDDDFIFKQGKEYSSADRLEDCVQFMNENPQCGLIRQCGFLGGSSYGRSITVNYNRSFDTARGFLIRPAGKFIHDGLFEKGACEDAMIAFTKIIQGFTIYNAFNCPTIKDKTTKMNAGNINYSEEFLRMCGFHKRYFDFFCEEFFVYQIKSESGKPGFWKLPVHAILMHTKAADALGLFKFYTMKYYRYGRIK